MMLLAEKITDTIDYLKAELTAAINQHLGFVNSIKSKYFVPEPGMWQQLVPFMEELGATIESVADDLRKYVLFDSSLEELTDAAYETVGDTADRFRKWSCRQKVTTKEAMEIKKRSKSTIYRWIQSGKLDAIKVNGRWVIAI